MPYFPPLVVTGGGGGPVEPPEPTAFVPTDIAGLKLWLDGADSATLTAGTPAPAPFTPKDVGGLTLWVDAADNSTMTVTGSGVSHMLNKGTLGGTFTQTVDAKRPVKTATAYGQALRFTSAASKHLSLGDVPALDVNEFTVFTVQRGTTAGSSDGPVIVKANDLHNNGWEMNAGFETLMATTRRVMLQAADGAEYWSSWLNQAYTVDDVFLASGWFAANDTVVAQINGAVRTPVATGAYDPVAASGGGPVVLGGAKISGTVYGQWDGDIYEVVFYSHKLTFAEFQQVEGYLAWKWGIQGFLHAAHPYKAAAPTVMRAGVTAWASKGTPPGALTQSTPASQPTLVDTSTGQGLRFTDVQGLDGLTDQACALSDMTLVGVMVSDPSGPGGAIIGCADRGTYDGWRLAGYGDNIQIDWSNDASGAYSSSTLNVSGNTPFIFAFRQLVPAPPPGNLNGGVDDTVAAIGDAYVSPTATPLTTYLGFDEGFAACFTGDVHEILVYDSALAMADRQKVEGYLAWKWGLEGSLPIDHPYTDAAPTTGGEDTSNIPSGPAGGALAGTYPDPTLAPGAVSSAQIVDNSVTNVKLATGPLGTMKGRRVSPFGITEETTDLQPGSIQEIISAVDVLFQRRLTVLAPTSFVPLSVQALTPSGETVLLELWRNLTPSGAHAVGAIGFWTKNLSGAKLYAAQIYSSMDVTTLGAEKSSLWLNTLTPGSGAQTQIRMSDGVVLGNPTGEYKGVGSINAQNGFYDNGVRLTAGGAQALSFRNALGRNGGMEVWQRGDGGTAVFAVAAGSSPFYAADGWYLYTSSNQACTVWQSPGLNVNSGFCMRVQRNSGQTGTASIKANFPLDTDEIVTLRGAIVTLSFTARAGATFGGTGGTLAAVLYTGTSSPGRRGQSPFAGETAVISGTTVALTTTATRYTFTSAVIVPVNAGQMEVGIGPAGYTGTAGANDYFEVDDIQLEIGTAATPFERRLFGDEIALCRRFYQKSFDYTILPAAAQGNFGAWSESQSVPAATVQQMCCVLPVEMRSTFSVSLFNTVAAGTQVQNTTTGVACTGTTATASGRRAINIATTTPAGSAVGNLLQIHATCNASL
jgi:hypothetical protein